MCSTCMFYVLTINVLKIPVCIFQLYFPPDHLIYNKVLDFTFHHDIIFLDDITVSDFDLIVFVIIFVFLFVCLFRFAKLEGILPRELLYIQ